MGFRTGLSGPVTNDIAIYAEHALRKWGAAEVDTTRGRMPTAQAMLAIAGAEGSWYRRAAGDCYDSLIRAGYPQAANEALHCSCALRGQSPEEACASWSSWQIYMPVHAAWSEQASGFCKPCAWAAWLCEVPNATEAAAAILASQGLGAWSTYTAGDWLQHLAAAEDALTAARKAVA